MSSDLPPGQRVRADFPRFGLPKYATRLAPHPDRLRIEIGGDLATARVLGADAFESLPRVEQVSDFHCVTTWSCTDLRWSGFRFGDVIERLVDPALLRADATCRAFLVAQDGYRTSLPLPDLLAADVLLADHLDGQSLGLAHGAPLRLVAPAHYGYKNVKHLRAIEFWRDARIDKGPLGDFMDHPRARVIEEERARGVPGRLLRLPYRSAIGRTVRKFREGLAVDSGAGSA